MKGQANIIVAVVFISLMLLALIPLFFYMYYSALNREYTYGNPMYRFYILAARAISEDIVAFYNAKDSTLLVTNRGGVDVVIERILIYVLCSSESYYFDLKYGERVPSGQSIVIDVSKVSEYTCRNPESMTLHILTPEGVVFSSTVLTQLDIEKITRPEGEFNFTIPAAIAASISILPMHISSNDNLSDISILNTKGFDIFTLDRGDQPTRLLPFTDLSRGMRGGTTTNYIWRLNRTHVNTALVISSQTVRNIWVGYDPRDPSKYNMILTADRLTIATPSFTSSNYTRVKIYGFRPSTPQGIFQLGGTWIRYPSQDVADYTFNNTALTLSGLADRVEIYIRVPRTEDSSYNPYILFMNTDGKANYAGILYTTIDRYWGFYNTRNEEYDTLLDFSTVPLALIYRGFSINNTEFSAAIIAINYRFHDNEGSDAEGTSVDRPVMIVGLVDEEGIIYTYRSYTFRELTRYEDTYPPTAQAQSSLVFIPLPPSEIGRKTFYVFVAFQDPYSYAPGNNLDDLDLTLFIESLAVIPIRK